MNTFKLTLMMATVISSLSMNISAMEEGEKLKPGEKYITQMVNHTDKAIIVIPLKAPLSEKEIPTLVNRIQGYSYELRMSPVDISKSLPVAAILISKDMRDKVTDELVVLVGSKILHILDLHELKLGQKNILKIDEKGDVTLEKLS